MAHTNARIEFKGHNVLQILYFMRKWNTDVFITILLFFFFGGTEAWTQGLTLAKQPSTPFGLVIFQAGLNFFFFWPRASLRPQSSYLWPPSIARVAGEHDHAWLIGWVAVLLTPAPQPSLASNCDPPDLWYPSSWAYRCGPLCHDVCFVLSEVLGIVLRTSYLLGRCSITWATLLAFLCYFWDRVSLYAWADLDFDPPIRATPCSMCHCSQSSDEMGSCNPFAWAIL
jgi:hypothetical protein